MPNLMKTIKQTMIKKGIPEETIAKFDFREADAKTDEILALIGQMDKLLSKEQCLSIMQEQGCCTTGKPAAAHRDFGRKYKDKTLHEKINLLHELETPHNPPCRLNPDGTLSVYWSFSQEGRYGCVCGFIKKLAQPVKISPTFCGCCGGHARKNLQKSLGVKLRLKEVVSSAASSGGKKSCEFLYEIETESAI